MRIDREMLAGSVAGLATVTGVAGWFVARRQSRLDARMVETVETVRRLESRMNEVDEELGVRLNEVDEEVEQLRRSRDRG
jgi:hypothetical protein